MWDLNWKGLYSAVAESATVESVGSMKCGCASSRHLEKGCRNAAATSTGEVGEGEGNDSYYDPRRNSITQLPCSAVTLKKHQSPVQRVCVSAKEVAENSLVQGEIDISELHTCSSDIFVQSSQDKGQK